MRDTLRDLRGLTDEGFVIAEVASDDACVRVTLRQGPLLVTLRLGTREAARLFE